MNENKYEQKVRQRAEELAQVQYDDLFATFTILPPGTAKTFAELTAGQKEMMISRSLPPARLSIQREAEAYSQGYSIGRDMENDPLSRSGLKAMLQSLGLAPENETE